MRRHGESFKEGEKLPEKADAWERKSTEKKMIAKKMEKKRKRNGAGEEDHDERKDSAGSKWVKMADMKGNDLIMKSLPPIAVSVPLPRNQDDDDVQHDGCVEMDAATTTGAVVVHENGNRSK